MQTIAFTVEGMSCEGCVAAIRRAVGQLDGVQQVEVSLEEKRVATTFDPARTTADTIRTRIEDAGYEVVT